MEIQRLKLEQANQAAGIAAAMRDGAIKNFAQPKPTEQEDPQLVAELNALRQRKSELEARMNDLQVGEMFLDSIKSERTLSVTFKAEDSVIRAPEVYQFTGPSLLVFEAAFTRGGLSRHHHGSNMAMFRG